ncbi:MAG: SDR family oxidoreductase [Chlamydiota bacterium]
MEKQTVVIFGASGAIGSTLARKLCQDKQKVILCSRNEEKLKQLAQELGAPYYLSDGGQETAVQALMQKIAQEEGPITGVVNCIGSFFIKPVAKTTLEEFIEVLRINLFTSFVILKASLEVMVAEGHGSLVLISSCAAQVGLVHHEAISAAKGAIQSLVKSAAASYAQKQIRINAVAPGLVDTPLSLPITSNEAALKTSLQFHPLGRIGKAEDIASAIKWLLSDESSWITGETLSVDGGLAHIKIKTS